MPSLSCQSMFAPAFARFFRTALFALCATLATPALGQTPLPAPTAPGVPYDYYLLTLSWSPEFCATHAGNEQCGHHLGFVVHGLWPENNDGSYPHAESCTLRPGPKDSSLWQGAIPTAYLAEHEWQAHGICTPYDPAAYFGLVRKAFQEVTIPKVYQAGDQPAMLTPQIILESFAQANPSFPAGSIVLNCANNRLTEVRVCLAKDLSPIPCRGVNSCRANAVKITSIDAR
jgi:ribonuclease T2